jgi:hypothetical protein
MRTLVVILTFMGIMNIIVGYINQKQTCPEPKIEYRYIPRTFEQDQNNPVKVSDIYSTMFNQPTPWLRGVVNHTSKKSDLDRYYISQG